MELAIKICRKCNRRVSHRLVSFVEMPYVVSNEKKLESNAWKCDKCGTVELYPNRGSSKRRF